MPSASSYTNKIRFSASVKNTKAQLPGGIGNLTQGSISGCGLDVDYSLIDYIENCGCEKKRLDIEYEEFPPPITGNIPGNIYTIVGTGVTGYSGDGGPAYRAQITIPFGIAFGPDGLLYFADLANQRIRKVLANGNITTVAGNGQPGDFGDGGPALSAQFRRPFAIAFGPDGLLYIADTNNHRIRKVLANGDITTVAGDGEQGDFGDGGPALSAKMRFPYSIAFGPDGSLYIADHDNRRIRKVSTSGVISTVVGTGSSEFYGDGGPAIQAQISNPFGIAFGPDGLLYISDTYNHRIRKVLANGNITTIAGNGEQGYSGDGDTAIEARIYRPAGISFASDGSLYFSDSSNYRIRKVVLST